MTDIVERLRGYLTRETALEAADEIERLRHPKIIVGSRELWEAMGKEIEMDEATLAAITAYDNYTRLPEDVMGYGPMRAALTAALPHLQNEIERLRAALEEAAKVAENYEPDLICPSGVAAAIRALGEKADD